MHTLYLLLWLLTPPEVLLTDPPVCWPVLKAFSHGAELWRYQSIWRADWVAEAHWVRNNYHRHKDAPSLSVLPTHFDKALAKDFLACNLAYRDYLYQEQSGWGEGVQLDLLRDAVRDTEHLRNIWEQVLSAADQGNEPYYRRQWLRELCRTQGVENVRAGRLPPPVPLWLFARID